MSALVLVAMLLAIMSIIALPRRWNVYPLFLFTFLTPMGQQFNLGGVHLFALRIVLLVGCVKGFCSKDELFSGGFNSIDKVFIGWVIARFLSFLLLYHQSAALMNQIGFIWDSMGGYLLLRYLIRSEEDIQRVAKVLVVVSIILAACMLYERMFQRDVFGMLMGGRVIPDLRNGKPRSQGPFEQSILAGAFGGTISPLFIWLIKRKARVAGLLGLASSLTIAITSGSSTGISALLIGCLVFCLWPLRRHMRKVRWGLVISILLLALIMKAPVWFLLARVDFVGGSTGWDRANLIDQFVNHFSSWWLIGTSDYPNWGYFTWDQCNQFVAEGENGGLVSLTLFFMLITRGFRAIGVARRHADGKDRAQEWLTWTLGALLCAHIASFMGISYFDQSQQWWFACLAMISAMATIQKKAVSNRREPTPEVAFNPVAMRTLASPGVGL